MKRGKKGSISIEAALVLPLFIFFLIALTNYIKIMVVYDNVSTAINSSVKTISKYSYLVKATGLKEYSQAISGTPGDAMQNWIDATGIFGGEEVNGLGDAITNFDPAAVDGETLKVMFKSGDFNEASLKLVMVLFDSGLRGSHLSSIDGVLSLGLEGFAESSIKSHFTTGAGGGDFDSIMKNFGVKKNGSEYFDFDGTKVVLAVEPNEITVVVSYKVGYEFLGKEIIFPITQRVTIAPWVGK